MHDVANAAGADQRRLGVVADHRHLSPRVPLAPLYPGDDVVDWVGLSVYFSSPTARYTAEVPSTIAEIDRFAPTKPIYVAETSVLPGARPALIRELVTGLLTIPNPIGLTWFNHDTNHDYRIDNDPEAAAAVAAHPVSCGSVCRTWGSPSSPHRSRSPSRPSPASRRWGRHLKGTEAAWRPPPAREPDRRRARSPVRRRRLAHEPPL